MYSNSLFTIETVFRRHGISFSYIEGFSTDLSSIDPQADDIWIVLGGVMGVYESPLYPYLTQEIRLIGERMKADKPMLGICLGSQLIATALGCPSYKGKKGPESGFFPLMLTEAGKQSPIRHFDPALTPVLQMHGDTFDLPPGATLLASSEKYTQQAFQVGRNCFGVQFHPEMNAPGFANTLVEDNGRIDVADFRAQGERHLDGMVRQMNLFMDELLEIWGITGS
jgi:GMP synthase (glutamine-hydrolysing)